MLESERAVATSPPLGHYSTTPVFNTKAVARETEVPADTFRAWERRYGIPRPQRTTGGHRLYSERDIAIIRWLRDRTAEGMNISQAVMLLTNSLSDAAEAPTPTVSALVSLEPRTLQRINEELLDALTAFESVQADRLLSEAFALYPVEDVLLHIVQPTMVEIGERWHRGEANIAVEHFSTQFVRRKLSSMINVFEGLDHGLGKILVACAPDELHDIGAMFGALFLVRRGWQVIYLGPQMPMADLLETIYTTRPEIVCLSASMPETAVQLVEIGEAIQEQFPHIAIGYGGRVFNVYPELRESMPGSYLGHDARAFVESVANLLAHGSTSAVEL